VGYSKSNTSPILKMFLSRIDDLTTRIWVDRNRPAPRSGGIGWSWRGLRL